jgi:predicted O-methyltransferase YrrM
MKDNFYVMRFPEHREGLQQMIDWVNNVTPTSEMRMIEIGSYVGESTLMFAQNFKEVVSVDPFVNYDVDFDFISNGYAPFDKVYAEFIKNTLPISNIKSVRDTSENAFPILNQQQWDMVYIDGLHTVDGVYYDITHYKSIIKPGGFVCGHDYGWGNIRHNLGKIFDDKVDATFKDGSWVVRV